jgi:hypothetical protein
VKLLPPPESTLGGFEGATSEEAVRLARQELGADAPVRCWRTRQGGLFGFFARERYIAGLEPPPGAIDPDRPACPPQAAQPRATAAEANPMNRTRRSRPSGRSAPASDPAVVTSGPPEPSEQAEQTEQTLWAALVEETTDEVVLGSRMSEVAFSDVLAEAEAAVSSADQVAVAEPVHPPTPAPPTADPAPVDGLGPVLVELGVPEAYCPDPGESNLDDLVRSLGRLPTAPPLPSRPGAVIVVVGSLRDARALGERVQAALGLLPADLVVAERTDAVRQRILRRRTRKNTTVVVVEASLASRSMASVAPWVTKLRPDHVLGVVPATAKRSDVLHWGGQLGPVDALGLSGVADTATPGELMGALPISHLDGSEASALRWAWVLLGRYVERQG